MKDQNKQGGGASVNGGEVTSVDVAKLAGVSQSSVCRVFDKKWSGKISDRVRQRVLAAAEQLEYHPNALARSLTASHSGIIGIVVSEDMNIFYYDLLRRITNLIQSRDRRVMLYTVDVYDDIDPLIRSMIEYRIDGLIITAAAAAMDVSLLNWSEKGLPLVLANIKGNDINCCSVVSDNYEGTRHMAHYLCACGCETFAYVSAANSAYADIPERKQGFLAGLREKGIAACIIEAGDYSYESGKAAARRLFTKQDRPDAVFCAGQRMALGVMDVVRNEFGLRIPQDVSVAGFDDLYIRDAVDYYNLTALLQSSDQMARTTVDLLFEQIEDGIEQCQNLLVPLTIKAGQTVRRRGE